MKRVYLGLGSNVGDRASYLNAAIEKMHGTELVLRQVSKVYENAAVEMTNQADFLNLVVEADTSMLPLRLLQRVLRVELELGRKRTVPKGPRTIDIDVLLYATALIQRTNLEIPHPRMTERRFVLQPLLELAPELRHPATRRPFAEYLGALTGQSLFETAIHIGVPLRSRQEST